MQKNLRTIAILATTTAGIVARLGAMLSQVVAAWFLSADELGTYAVALGVLGFTNLLRAGGVGHFAPTVIAANFDAKAGRLLWWGAAFMLFGAILTWASALSLPYLPFTIPPHLDAVLWLLGLRQAILAFVHVPRARMLVNLRFTELAKLDTANAILRLALLCALVASGAGVVSLVIPNVVTAAVELAWCGTRSGLRRSDCRWTGSIASMWQMLAWPAVTAALVSLNGHANFLVVKSVVPLATVGIFYFAFQVATQPTTLLTSALTSVFAAITSRQRGDERRENLAIQGAFEGSMFLVPLVMFAVVALFPSAEHLLWRGKWAEAVVPVALIAVSGCWSTPAALLSGPLAGLRRFRAVAAIEAVKAVGVLGGALIGTAAIQLARGLAYEPPAWLPEETIVSGSTAVSISAVSVGQLWWLMRRHGMEGWRIVRNLLHGPALGLVAAIAALSIASSASDSLRLGGSTSGRVVEFCVASAVYGGTTLLALRFVTESMVRDVLNLVPVRARGVVARLLGL